tara:strand:+ start:21298 stop:21636 length:339 start_codon:yes stop_codon:yes gene_type:complete
MTEKSLKEVYDEMNKQVFALEVFANVFYVGNIPLNPSTGSSMITRSKSTLTNFIRKYFEKGTSTKDTYLSLAKIYACSEKNDLGGSIELPIDMCPKTDITNLVIEYKKDITQ